MDVNFNVAFASDATKSSITEETWKLGWVEVVGGINGVPTAQQFNEVCYTIDIKANLAYKKAQEAMALATKTSESLLNYAPKDHTHNIEDIEDFPDSFPADGGNADTVNEHTVDSDVPENALFVPTGGAAGQILKAGAEGEPVWGEETTYSDANTTKAGLMGIGAQVFAGNKTFNGQIIPNGASDLGVAQARKIYAGTEDMEAGVSPLATGDIYLVYE